MSFDAFLHALALAAYVCAGLIVLTGCMGICVLMFAGESGE